MIVPIILILLVLAIMREKRTKSEEVEGSKNFHMSQGGSKDVYLQMHADGMSQDDLIKFVKMEDQFLELERSGQPHIVTATCLSNKIKETFPKYDFSYHTTHLKKISRSI